MNPLSFIAAAALGILGAGSETIEVPLSLRLDRDYVSSKIFVRCSGERIDQDFASFAKRRAAGDSEAAFDDVFGSFLSGDASSALARARSEVPQAEIEDLVRGYGDLLKHWEGVSPRVYIRLHLGDDDVFVWGADGLGGTSGKMRRGTVIQRAGRPLWKPIKDEMLPTLIVNALHRAAADPEPSALSHARFEAVLPGTESSPVTLCFDGTRVDPALGVSSLSAPSAAVWSSALEAAGAGHFDRYIQLLSEESATGFSQWLAQTTTELKESFRETYVRARAKLLFRMDAGPADIYFYSSADGTVGWDYVKTLGKEPRIASLYASSVLDQFLGSAMLFSEGVLKPLVAGETSARAGSERSAGDESEGVASEGEAEERGHVLTLALILSVFLLGAGVWIARHKRSGS